MTAIFETVGTMARALDFHMIRQNLISANIANVDTPGYAPRELLRPLESDFARHMPRPPLALTDARHIAGIGGAGEQDLDVEEEHVAVPGNDLNFVSIDHEMARLSANTIKYEAITRAVGAQLGMLRYGASDARG